MLYMFHHEEREHGNDHQLLCQCVRGHLARLAVGGVRAVYIDPPIKTHYLPDYCTIINLFADN